MRRCTLGVSVKNMNEKMNDAMESLDKNMKSLSVTADSDAVEWKIYTEFSRKFGFQVSVTADIFSFYKFLLSGGVAAFFEILSHMRRLFTLPEDTSPARMMAPSRLSATAH